MSREIKFRSYGSNKMHYKLSYGKVGTKVSLDHHVKSIDVNEALSSPDVHLMQYTGIKDKNGRDIYEGDLIRVRDSSTPPDGVIREVAWVGLGWTLQLTIDDKEVVGNVYEHRELLEDQ